MRRRKPEQTRGPAGGTRLISASNPGVDTESSRFFMYSSFFMSSAFLEKKEKTPAKMRRLDLGLLEAVLPEGGEGSISHLAEVNQDVPRICQYVK